MDAENRKREETLFHWNMVKGSQNTGKTKQKHKTSKTKDKKAFQIENTTQEGKNRMDWLPEQAQEALALS